MAVQAVGFRVLHVIGEKAQIPFGGDRRVELSQAARRRVAGIGEKRQPRFFPRGVQLGEAVFAHVHFAAQFQMPGDVAEEAKRQVLHRFQIFRDVLADDAVAAGGSLNELAVFEDQRHRQAVDFQFAAPGDPRLPDAFRRPLQPVMKLVFRENVFEAEHRLGVRDLFESVQHRAADALRRRIVADQVGMFPFELKHLAHQRVVFVVLDFRSVQNVIETPMTIQLVDEPIIAVQFFPFHAEHHLYNSASGGKGPLPERSSRFYEAKRDRLSLCMQNIDKF